MLYTQERDRYPTVEQLPAASFPAEFLSADPNLALQAHYKLVPAAGGPAIQIGPRTISVSGEPDAPHLDLAYINGELRRLLSVFDGLGLVTSYDRLGLRYINFFEKRNVMEQSTFGLSLEGDNLIGNTAQLRVELPFPGFTAALSVATNAQVAFGNPVVRVSPSDAKTGSVLDIDVYADPLKLKDGNRPDQLIGMFRDAHDVAKKLFFKALTDDLILELGPED
ncbi:uncharacterized protein (TIGR04255 family) [Burkholderia sp. PvR073]